VACSNWKRIMIVLSESLLQEGVPYRDPLAVPQEMVHNSSLHFTFNKFWKRSREVLTTPDGGFNKGGFVYCHVKLQKYTKFLFAEIRLVRLISAIGTSLSSPIEEFSPPIRLLMLRRHGNHLNPPAAVGLRCLVGISASSAGSSPTAMPPCQIQYDFVGQLETVEEDAEQLLRVLKVDNVVDFPPSHRNHTASSWQEDWFNRVPLVARRGLYRLYEPDFRLFGYSRPDSLLD
ncbi:carbohydrate sulfotransferase 12-like, partial [Oncorhynchus nerka]|uniref:carbohydrate sulfotransferase 12-like n=1 Tax=Oncorhynchus nerka TaxID=8023 RepID=UPI0031B8A737